MVEPAKMEVFPHMETKSVHGEVQESWKFKPSTIAQQIYTLII